MEVHFPVNDKQIANEECGMSIAFLAPDGSGKSTVIQGITNTCADYFKKVSYFHFRPEWLRNLGQIHVSRRKQEPPKPLQPGEEPPRNATPHAVKKQGKLVSLIRFMYYNLDFVFGHFFKIMPLKRKHHLIVFDRYYYDYFGDMIRYRYDISPQLVQFCSFFIPKPDIVFILDADENVVYERKKEVPIEEIARQRKAYASLLDRNINAVMINVDRNVEDIISEVTGYILDCRKHKIGG